MQGPFLRKYGVATTINFSLYEVDGVDLRKDATVGTADLFIMKDEGTEAAATNAATDEGRGYSLALTATEMQAARIVIYVEDQTATKVWLDDTIVIETYGDASAQHAFDLDEANQLSANTIAEQSQGAPPAAPTAEEILSYLYMRLVRNKVTTDSSDHIIFADDTTTQVWKQSITDSGGTFTQNEAVSGT